MYDIHFACPDDPLLIDTLLDAATAAGAGTSPHYSRVASITRCEGTWRSEPGARPHIGAVGEVSVAAMAHIAMRCSEDALAPAIAAIRAAHPFEEPFIGVIELHEASV